VFFEDVHREHNFDPMAFEDAMKELFISTKCTKLIATNIAYESMHNTWSER
jgi:hypothetical protein